MMPRPLPILLFTLAAIVPLAAARAPQAAPQPPPAVKVGDIAPDFTLEYLAPTPDGKFQEKKVSLAEFRGKKTVILAFFPAAFSPG